VPGVGVGSPGMARRYQRAPHTPPD